MTSVSDEKWRPFNYFFSQVGLRTYQRPCKYPVSPRRCRNINFNRAFLFPHKSIGKRHCKLSLVERNKRWGSCRILGGIMIFGLGTPTVIAEIIQHFGNRFLCRLQLRLFSCVWDVLSHWSRDFDHQGVWRRLWGHRTVCVPVSAPVATSGSFLRIFTNLVLLEAAQPRVFQISYSSQWQRDGRWKVMRWKLH
jgi:hypothetical protein